MKSFTLLLLVIILSSLALAKSVELHLNNDEPNHLGKRNIADYVRFLQCSRQYGSCKYCNSFDSKDIHYGIENGKKCCIYVEGCEKAMECPGLIHGFRCCRSGAPVDYRDEIGDWGVEGSDWCSIRNY